jgi:hypothetical protein
VRTPAAISSGIAQHAAHAAVGAGAVGEAVAARIDDLGERGADGGEVGDLLIDLGDLADGPLAQVRARVAAAAGVEQAGDLVEGEAEPLRRLDHVEQGDGVGWVEPVPAVRAVRFGQQPAAFVVTQRLDVDAGLFRDLAGAQPALFRCVHRDTSVPSRGGPWQTRTSR